MKAITMVAVVFGMMAGVVDAGSPAKLVPDEVPKITKISESYGYVKFGWSVRIQNRGGTESRGGWLTVKFLDKGGVAIHEALERFEPVPPFRTGNVTDTCYVSSEVYRAIRDVQIIAEER
jgi:hypothetical protein